MLIDLAIIALIESGGYEHAYNVKTKAYGLYQIRKCVVDDFNKAHKASLTVKMMMTKEFAERVAGWYLNEQIPKYLKSAGLPDTLNNRLACWNWGFGNVRRASKTREELPLETRKFIIKYQLFEKGFIKEKNR